MGSARSWVMMMVGDDEWIVGWLRVWGWLEFSGEEKNLFDQQKKFK